MLNISDYNQLTGMWKDEENKELSIKERIYNFCKRGGVSFAEIEKAFGKGDLSYGIKGNQWAWFTLTEDELKSIDELYKEKKILFYPTTILVYLCDGLVPNVPIAKTSKDYKDPHWLPLVIWRTEMIRGQLKPKIRKIYREKGWDV